MNLSRELATTVSDLSSWTLTFSGSSAFSTGFGDIIHYDAPGQGAGNHNDPLGTVGPFGWNGFSLSNNLALTATRETANGKVITVRVPIVGSGTTSLTIARPGGYTWTFTSSSVTLKIPSNVATFTFKVSESPVAGAWPDVDLTAAATMGDVTVTAHANYGYSATDVNGLAVATFAAPEADLTITAKLGGASVRLGAHWRRVDDGGGPYSAWGINGGATATMGMLTAAVDVMHAVGYDSWGVAGRPSNPYYYFAGDRFWQVAASLTAALNANNSLGLLVTWNTAPTIALSTIVDAKLTWTLKPYGDSTLTIATWAALAWAQNGGLFAPSAGVSISIPIQP